MIRILIMDLQRTGTQVNNSGRVQDQDSVCLQSNLLKKHSRFPINPSTDTKKRHLIKKATPWETYQKFFILDQAGPVILAHHKAKDFEIVAIKESKMTTGNGEVAVDPIAIAVGRSKRHIYAVWWSS